MPYITQDRRAAVLADPLAVATPGELNFLITARLVQSPRTIEENVKLILQYAGNYLNRYGARYGTFNDVLGVFTAIAFEYKDRVVNGHLVNAVHHTLGVCTGVLYEHEVKPYEKAKREENGDVF